MSFRVFVFFSFLVVTFIKFFFKTIKPRIFFFQDFSISGGGGFGVVAAVELYPLRSKAKQKIAKIALNTPKMKKGADSVHISNKIPPICDPTIIPTPPHKLKHPETEPLS